MTRSEMIHLFIQWLAANDVLDWWMIEMGVPNSELDLTDADRPIDRRVSLIQFVSPRGWCYLFPRDNSIRGSEFWTSVHRKWTESKVLHLIIEEINRDTQ